MRIDPDLVRLRRLMHELDPMHAKLLTWASQHVRLGLTSTSREKGLVCRIQPILHTLLQSSARPFEATNRKVLYDLERTNNFQPNKVPRERDFDTILRFVRKEMDRWLLRCVGRDANPRMWSRIMKTLPSPEVVSKRIIQHRSWLKRLEQKYKNVPMLKIPGKRRVAPLIKEWTGDWFRKVQQARLFRSDRGNKPIRSRTAREIEYALMHYMRHMALRAPHLPPEFAHVQKIYRGTSLTNEELAAFRKTGQITSKRFMSFSLSKSVADVASNGYVSNEAKATRSNPVTFTLRTKNIEPYTPWIFFTSRRIGGAASILPIEEEVLLPPGTLHLRKTTLTYTPLDEWQPRKVSERCTSRQRCT
jgi:hypothetical protein